MLFLDPGVQEEYERWRSIIGDEDPYASHRTIGIHEVLRAHFLILDFFSHEKGGEGVGGVGPKALDLLHSAVYRQFISNGGREKWPSPLEKCATLLFGIVKDHPFHDANKRTGFLVMLFFLQRLGRTPKIRQKEFEDFVVEVADNRLEQYPGFREARKRVDDPEIQFIADFIRSNTREVDHRSYTVTFHQLDQIIKAHGFKLDNAKGNYIDVLKIEHRRKYFNLLGPEVREETRIARIGFPGWKRQVMKGALKTVREVTGLTAEKGFDSRAFFQGADPLHTLIDTYSEPLRRLANR